MPLSKSLAAAAIVILTASSPVVAQDAQARVLKARAERLTNARICGRDDDRPGSQRRTGRGHGDEIRRHEGHRLWNDRRERPRHILGEAEREVSRWNVACGQ